MASKGDPRAAAERLEKGIERYGDGDLVAAAVELEEALRLMPDHARAKEYLSWVKDVLAGTRGPGKRKDLDEDAVRAVTEALDSEPELTRPEETQWDPVPLTPSSTDRPAPSAMATLPYVDGDSVPERPATSPTQAPSQPMAIAPTELALQPLDAPLVPAQPSAPPPSKTPSQPSLSKTPSQPNLRHGSQDRIETAPGTILGIAPQRESMLSPIARPAPAEDRPESVTKEFARGTPTLHNLRPLDVPELTEEQIAELISLESSLPTTGPGGRALTPDLATTPDLPTERKAFIEFEAEPTPEPRRIPALTRKEDTTPDASLKLQPLPFASDFDPLEMTPTRARIGAPQPPVLNPLPVDERPELAPREDEGDPTNPFIQSNLRQYAFPQEDSRELPPSPTRPMAKLPHADKFAAAKRALAERDAAGALDIADEVVTEAGGTEAEPVLPYLSLLEKIYESVIGGLAAVPRHGGAVPDLDPRAAFLLSRIDGTVSVDDLLDISGMPRLEAMRVLALLVRHGAVVTK